MKSASNRTKPSQPNDAPPCPSTSPAPVAVNLTWSPARQAAISAARAFNMALDTLFYNVNAVTPDQAELSALICPEGAVLIVPPSGSSQPIRALTSDDFVREQSSGNRQDPIDTLAVAGVGSSALGTAALARDVADFLQKPVAAVVSGFGIADLMTEAMGGGFILGAKNAWRDFLARVFHAFQLPDHVRHQPSHDSMKRHFHDHCIDADRYLFGSPDSAAMLYLLTALDKIKMVVGHSKGNLSIENALEGWHQAYHACPKGKIHFNPDLCIVTLSAVIRFPEVFRNVRQFIGQIDVFGFLNSRPFLEHTAIPRAWHSLNSAFLGHLSVAQALELLKVKNTLRQLSVKPPIPPKPLRTTPARMRRMGLHTRATAGNGR